MDAVCESRTDVHARSNPSSNASFRFLPLLSSSFNLSKIRIFPSIASPIEIINPAIAAADKVTGSSLNIERTTIA